MMTVRSRYVLIFCGLNRRLLTVRCLVSSLPLMVQFCKKMPVNETCYMLPGPNDKAKCFWDLWIWCSISKNYIQL